MKVNDNGKLIDSILADLYGLDPELKANESELRQTVERLLEHRLETKIDRKFVAHLRKDLLMSAVGGRTEEIKSVSVRHLMKNITLALGGSAVLAALLLVAVSALSPGGFRLPGIGPSLPSGRVVVLGPQSFGSLAAAGGVLGAPEGATEEQVVGRGGGGGMPTAPGAPSVIGMPAPEFEKMTMTYAGEPLEEIGEDVTVYRRIKGLPTASLASAFSKRDNGLFDLGRLSGLQMRNVSVSHIENGQEYWIHLDFREGMASVNMEEGMREVMPAATEVPDQELITLANAFLDRYGIDRAPYGEPQVDDRWRDGIVEEEASYFPTYVGVVYPFIVGGETAVGWDGEPYGMRVNINVATRKAQGVNLITGARFESSAYPAETDTARIISLAEQGGYTGPIYLEKGTQADIRLGTPKLMYFQHYVHDGRTGTSDELYVPALFFPIENVPEGVGFYRNYVVVPLAKELLDQREDMLGDVPVPMPLIEPAVMSTPVVEE